MAFSVNMLEQFKEISVSVIYDDEPLVIF